MSVDGGIVHKCDHLMQIWMKITGIRKTGENASTEPDLGDLGVSLVEHLPSMCETLGSVFRL